MNPPAALILFVALALPGCRAGDDENPVVLRLGSGEVRRAAFLAEVARFEARGGAPLAPEAKRGLLEDFLAERVVELEARATGRLPPGASDEQTRAAVQELLAEAAAGAAPVGDAEVAKAFEARRESYRTEETVTLSQILVPTLNEARDVLRLLRKAPREFEQLARARSRGPEASQGGRLGAFGRGQLPPALEQAAFRLAPGAIAEIVETPFGFHVLRLDERTPAAEPVLAEVADRVRAELERERADQALRAYVRGLLARAEVNYEAALSAPDAPR